MKITPALLDELTEKVKASSQLRRNYAVGGKGVLRRALVVALMLVVCMEPASAQMSKLKFGKYGVEKIRIKSRKSGTGQAWVMTENADKTFVMSDIKGTVYKNGVPFVTGSCEPVKVLAGSSKVVVDGKAQFCDGVSLMDVLKCVNLNVEEYTIDISMTVFNADTIREVTKTGIELKRLLKKM